MPTTHAPSAVVGEAQPSWLSTSQLKARLAFDLDATMDGLPSRSPPLTPQNRQGHAGVRLRSDIRATISPALLREFANEVLRAKRCSEAYLEALRIVLANQGRAERFGYLLELNQRVSFAPERVMRTILTQMFRAEIVFGKNVSLGEGRFQLIKCFARKNGTTQNPELELGALLREEEAGNDARREEAERRSELQPCPRLLSLYTEIQNDESTYWPAA